MTRLALVIALLVTVAIAFSCGHSTNFDTGISPAVTAPSPDSGGQDGAAGQGILHEVTTRPQDSEEFGVKGASLLNSAGFWRTLKRISR